MALKNVVDCNAPFIHTLFSIVKKCQVICFFYLKPNQGHYDLHIITMIQLYYSCSQVCKNCQYCFGLFHDVCTFYNLHSIIEQYCRFKFNFILKLKMGFTKDVDIILRDLHELNNFFCRMQLRKRVLSILT